MRVFQIGAGGNVGRRLSTILSQQGDHATGMHRSPDQASAIKATGATPLQGDLIKATVGELAAKMTGHDAVVFSAGAHGTGRDLTTLIDGEGLKKAADAARLAGVTRFVLVSAFPESERGKSLGEDFEHYMRTKKAADIYLATTDLDWVIVRPGLLTDAEGSGSVRAGVAVPYGEVSRDNVAAFINTILHNPEVNKIIVELTDGQDPVRTAADQLAHR